VPGAVHAEVRVQGEVVVNPGQQMFASADHLADDAAGEIGGGKLRHPEVGGGQLLAGECLVQAATGQPHGVTLGHRTIVPLMLARCMGLSSSPEAAAASEP